jgi:hypothetical protein
MGDYILMGYGRDQAVKRCVTVALQNLVSWHAEFVLTFYTEFLSYNMSLI